MYLDVNTASLGGLDVQGSLVFLCGNITLTSDWIQVTGVLRAGTQEHPMHDLSKIRLTHSYSCNAEEQQTLAVEGTGLLRLIGRARGPSWTRLSSTALANASTLQLQVAPTWGPGQQIVIASTDFDRNQAEVRTIQSVSGSQVTLTQALNYTHWGATEGQAYNGVGVPQYAEVAQFGRHIVVEGTPYVDGGGRTIAGHAILREPGATPPRAELNWVEFRELGKEGTLGKYPIHFHEIGDASASYVKNCSIHDSYNRAISIHNTQNLRVQDNFCFDVRGHAYYFEDDPVVGCTVQRNLGLLTEVPAVLIPGVTSDNEPATFWLHNPDNVIEDNMAAGAAAYGFWFETDSGDATPWTSFQRNVAHSNEVAGFWQDTRPEPSPAALYQDLVAYKNRQYGFWLRSYGTSRIVRAAFADNRGGFYLASEGFQFDADEYIEALVFNQPPPLVDLLGISKTTVEDSLVIGESSNLGTPTTCEELAYGRSLPETVPLNSGPLLPKWATLTGVELYDGLIGIEDTIFADFQDLSVSTSGCSSPTYDRRAGAVHQVRYNSPWAVDPRNYVSGASFFNVDSPVYLRTPNGLFEFCNTEIDDGGVANTIVQDLDGSLTGIPGSSVFPDGPTDDFLVPYSGATKNSQWNAYVTSGPPSTPFAQLDFYNLNGLFPQGTSADKVAFKAVLRNEWFVKPGPFLNLCSPSTEVHPRHVTNLVTNDVYEIHYDAAVPQTDWAVVFTLALQYTAPGQWVYVTVPIIPPATGKTLDVVANDTLLQEVSGPVVLYNGAGNGYWYDSGAQRIHMKLVAGGTGSTIFDGTRTVFAVWSHQQ